MTTRTRRFLLICSHLIETQRFERPSRPTVTRRFSSLVSIPAQDMRYHFFISHMQAEASGDVGTMYHLFSNMGINCWRDMNLKGEITKVAMERGVKDSEAFIVFLTNSYLSRPFCLYELERAIAFKKPILIVVEKEDRFWPWDIERWRTNRCTRDSNNKWIEGWLSRKYEDCPEKIVELIERHHENGLMLEYRRRGFEIDALTREIALRVRRTKCVSWGGTLPPDRELLHMKHAVRPSVYVLHDRTTRVVRKMARDFERTTRKMLPDSRVVQELKSATDVVILLTRQLLKEGSESLREMLRMTSEMRASALTFVYLNVGHEAWDWSLPSKVVTDDAKRKSKLQTSICGREAYIWRGMDVPHEHNALVRDIVLKRFSRHVRDNDVVTDETSKEVSIVDIEEEDEMESSESEGSDEVESSEEEEESSVEESSEESSVEESSVEESSEESDSNLESENEDGNTESKVVEVETKQPIRVKKKNVRVRVPSKFLKHQKADTVKKNYKVRVPSKVLKKAGAPLVKTKLKVRVPSKFFKPITEKHDATTISKKKLKVRVPSKFLRRAVKKQVAQKQNSTKRHDKNTKVVNMKISNREKETASSSALTKLKRFVRTKRQVKVHPIVEATDRVK